MTNTEEIQKELEKLYERKGPATVDIPLELQAKELGFFARDYIAAAAAGETAALIEMYNEEMRSSLENKA